MTFRVLQAEGADADLWQEALEDLPAALRDLHYTPGYGRIYRDIYGYEPLLAVYRSGPQLVVHAFVRRSLEVLPFLAEAPDRAGFTDIATPYGFGGALIARPEAEDSAEALAAFDRHFRGWCIDRRIASEFVCLHPLLGNHALIARAGIAEPHAQKSVIVVDLRGKKADLLGAVSRGTRSSILRAGRSGVSVEEVAVDERALARFQALYFSTMRRRGAQPRWLFPDGYFPACVHYLGADRSALLVARCEGEWAAAYLLINDEQTAYYHFGASDERWLDRRPNNLLMYEAMLWAKRRGLQRFHLGGGVSSAENDSLLRFKSSFGGYKTALYTYGRVLAEEPYRQLCALKLAYEQRTHAAVADPEYFPLYRR